MLACGGARCFQGRHLPVQGHLAKTTHLLLLRRSGVFLLVRCFAVLHSAQGPSACRGHHGPANQSARSAKAVAGEDATLLGWERCFNQPPPGTPARRLLYSVTLRSAGAAAHAGCLLCPSWQCVPRCAAAAAAAAAAVTRVCCCRSQPKDKFTTLGGVDVVVWGEHRVDRQLHCSRLLEISVVGVGVQAYRVVRVVKDNKGVMLQRGVVGAGGLVYTSAVAAKKRSHVTLSTWLSHNRRMCELTSNQVRLSWLSAPHQNS